MLRGGVCMFLKDPPVQCLASFKNLYIRIQGAKHICKDQGVKLFYMYQETKKRLWKRKYEELHKTSRECE
jgi:hypothetical protein